MNGLLRVTQVRLRNIKCFDDVIVNFTSDDKKDYNWITLLGENATGKTTVLQSIALLLAGFENVSSLYPRPDTEKTERGRVSKELYDLNRQALRKDRSEYIEKLAVIAEYLPNPEAVDILQRACQASTKYAAFARALMEKKNQ